MNQDLNNNAQIWEFWKAYTTAFRINGAEFTVFAFGDSPELADALVDLVLAGSKRATASLVSDYVRRGQQVPRLGAFSIVVDGRKAPCCIIRSVWVEIKPLRDVDASFAWAEGEGDRSLAWWLSAHRRYFKRQGAREGFSVDDSTEVVLERFEVVWPPEFADRQVSLVN